jgi:penicillin-binding protein 1A
MPAVEPAQKAWHRPPPLPLARRLGRWLWPVLITALLGTAVGIGVGAAIHMPRVDSLAGYTPTLATELYDRHGGLYKTYARERRILLEEGQLPPTLVNALIATEDTNFFRHGGIDALGVVRAALSNTRSDRRSEGASTLTMQLARMLFLSPEKRWRRKIEESFLAVEIEKNFTKEKILTLYCNLAPLGHGQYGMEAAARFYFGKSVGDLTPAEAATLIGILPRPSDYSPYRRPELVLKRRNHVLGRMLEEGYLPRADYDAALASPLGVVEQRPTDEVAPYFAEEIRKILEAKYGATKLYESGMRVATTLDPAIQAAAERALHRGLARLDKRRGWRGHIGRVLEPDIATAELPTWTGLELVPGRWYQGLVLASDATTAVVKIQDEEVTVTSEGVRWTGRSRPNEVLGRGEIAWFRLEEEDEAKDHAPRWKLEQEPEIEGAALVLESASGAVRGMVGGWSFERSRFNRAVQAERQVGSAFKVFVYGAALEQGMTPTDTVFDGPTAFKGADGRLSYLPQNHTRKFSGIITLRRALELSINVPAVKVQDMIGTRRVIDFARRAGIASKLPPYPSLALGSADLRPIEMAAAFASFANGGTWVEPYVIERIDGAQGRPIESHLPRTRTVTTPQVAYVLTHMLEGVVDRGTAQRLSDLPLDIAGKTGTTDDYSDAWFIGYTPRYTILTWVGFDVKKSLGRGMDGASAAAPIWRMIAERGLEEGWIAEDERFRAPSGVVFVPMGESFQEAYVSGRQPTPDSAPTAPEAIADLPWYQQRAFYTPKAGEPMDSPVDAPLPAEERPAEGSEPP